MGVWFSCEGSITVRECDETETICGLLQDDSGEMDVHTEHLDGDAGGIRLHIGGGTESSYNHSEGFLAELQKLGPYAVATGEFEYVIGSEVSDLLVGTEEQIAETGRLLNVKAAEEAMDYLRSEDREAVIAKFIDSSKWSKLQGASKE